MPVGMTPQIGAVTDARGEELAIDTIAANAMIDEIEICILNSGQNNTKRVYWLKFWRNASRSSRESVYGKISGARRRYLCAVHQ